MNKNFRDVVKLTQIIMTSLTLIGYDYSGSTGNKPFYHSKTQEIVSNIQDKTIACWDTNCEIIRFDKLKYINTLLLAGGGTEPNCLVDYIIETNFHGHLVLITDGEISGYSVIKCCDKLIDWKFEKVSVYLINNGYRSDINESISCAFTRNSPHSVEIYEHDSSLKNNIIVSEDDFELINKISDIDTIDEFINKTDIFDNVLMSINMGTKGNNIIHKNLVQLKNRLIKNSSNIKGNVILEKLIEDTNVINLKNVWNLYYIGNNDWTKQIDKYISWCSGSLENSFDRNSNREISRDITVVVSSETASIEKSTSESFSIECPVMLEKSTNLIILFNKVHNESFFDEIPDNMRESLINCPLNALKSEAVIKILKKRLGNGISIEGYKELVEHGMSDKSPLTRDEIMGGLCLGKDFSHVKATNSTIRHGLSGGKSLGNVDLWYAVFYLMVEIGYVEHLKEFLPSMREHMIFRLNTSKTYMCLSGLPTFPTYKVPLKTALWSVISATSIHNIKPENDPLRLHLSYSEYIIELTEMTELRFPNGIDKHINRLKALRFLLNTLKKDKKILNLINALKYNAIETPELWVMIDGTPTLKQIENVRSKLPEFCKYLHINDIIYIMGLCNANKNEVNINIPYDYKTSDESSSYTKNWDYDENIPYYKVEISLNTCRPFYNIDKDKTWIDVVNEVYGTNYISIDSRFGEFVIKNEKYPTKNEFLVYLYNYYSSRGKTTLPICVEQFVDEVLEDHNYIIENLPVSEYVKRWKNSVSIKERIKIE